MTEQRGLVLCSQINNMQALLLLYVKAEDSPSCISRPKFQEKWKGAGRGAGAARLYTLSALLSQVSSVSTGCMMCVALNHVVLRHIFIYLLILQASYLFL